MYKTPKKDGVDESPLDSTGDDLRKSLPKDVRIDSDGYKVEPQTSPENESEQSEYDGEEKKDSESDDDDDDDDASNVSSLSHDLSDLVGKKKGKARMAAGGRRKKHGGDNKKPKKEAVKSSESNEDDEAEIVKEGTKAKEKRRKYKSTTQGTENKSNAQKKAIADGSSNLACANNARAKGGQEARVQKTVHEVMTDHFCAIGGPNDPTLREGLKFAQVSGLALFQKLSNVGDKSFETRLAKAIKEKKGKPLEDREIEIIRAKVARDSLNGNCSFVETSEETKPQEPGRNAIYMETLAKRDVTFIFTRPAGWADGQDEEDWIAAIKRNPVPDDSDIDADIDADKESDGSSSDEDSEA